MKGISKDLSRRRVTKCLVKVIDVVWQPGIGANNKATSPNVSWREREKPCGSEGIIQMM
jgi:hypothetical protein